MRAISQEALGGPEVLMEVELDRPEPSPNQILVEVHAAGVNAADWKTRAGGGFLGQPPFVLGWDVSGVVTAVGLGVTIYRAGDEVHGMPNFPAAGGAYAEYLTGPARHFAPKPAGIDHLHAAALPLVGLTAWQALVDTVDVQEGQRVLVHAAAGGLGHIAVQVAKARGAHVIGTARTTNHDFLRDLGADEVIDYTAVDFADVVSDVDAVLDPIGGDYPERSLRTLRRGGTLVSLSSPDAVTPAVAAEAERIGVEARFVLVEPDRAGLRAIGALVEAGVLRSEVTPYPLADVGAAHQIGESGHVRGKLVLSLR